MKKIYEVDVAEGWEVREVQSFPSSLLSDVDAENWPTQRRLTHLSAYA